MRRRRRGQLRRALLPAAVVLFTAAAVAGAYLSIFCFHYYAVASNSMSPTLMGNDDRRDRVLCWLKSFPGREPRRWEIVIFHTPTGENLELLPQGRTPADLRGMTIKRVIGLGGEELSLRGGDVWTRRGKGGPFLRQVKPRGVQDAMWIPVYDEAFPEARAEEFAHFWRSRHGDAADSADGLLIPGGAEFLFRPAVRAGRMGREMRDMPGVIDRYLLPQNLSFVCPGCGAEFARWFGGGQVRERCPSCSAGVYEENVLVYSHDSGLTGVGPDAVEGIPPGSANRTRVYPYRVVGDLRLSLEVNLPYAESGIALRLEKDGETDEAVVSPGGVSFNGRPVPAAPEVKAGAWTAVEFCRVDGELRLTVNGEAAALPGSARAEEMPEADAFGEFGEFGGEEVPRPRSSGASFGALSSGALLRRVSLGRDVHYFSGVGNPYMPQFSAMSAESEILLPNGTFFTLGDNTDVSLDSRSWGAVPASLLAGTALWWDRSEHLPGDRR